MSPLTAAVSNRPQQPILTITTSKNWVLPPRPKNARKAKATEKKKKLPVGTTTALRQPLPKTTVSVVSAASAVPMRTNSSVPVSVSVSTSTSAAVHPDSVEDLHSSIRVIDRENYQLKTKLLSLIHDYKTLRALVLHTAASNESPAPALYDSATTARKRLYTEMGDPMNELILNMNELSYKSPNAELLVEQESLAIDIGLFDFVNLDSDFDDLDDHEKELPDGEIDDELDSQSLSRLISPSVSEADENLLMTSLTRSTTVSTNNSIFEKKPVLLFKFYDLPAYSEDDYAFSFEKIDPHDKMMAVIEEDHYNQVADFLEEKLMSNDGNYYVEKNNLLESAR